MCDPLNIDFKIKTTQWFNTYKTTTIHDGNVSFTKQNYTTAIFWLNWYEYKASMDDIDTRQLDK